MYGLLAVEPTEWNAWAIVALLVTNAATLYPLFKKERRTDGQQDAAREDTLVGQWRAWGKAMEKARNEAVRRQQEAEDRERKLIAEVSRLAECVRQTEDRIGELEAGPGRGEGD